MATMFILTISMPHSNLGESVKKMVTGSSLDRKPSESRICDLLLIKRGQIIPKTEVSCKVGLKGYQVKSMKTTRFAYFVKQLQ